MKIFHMNDIIYALFLTLIAGGATGIGGALVLFKKKLSSSLLSASLGLSAGVMIFISLAELYPEASALLEAIPHGKTLVLVAFFLGMGLITLIDFLVPEYENPHEAPGLTINQNGPASIEGIEDGRILKKLGIISAIAIAIHNFPEGMATFIGGLNGSSTSSGITFAIALHNIPEGIAVAIPIYYATKSKGRALLYSLLSGLTEPIGAAIGYLITVIAGIDIGLDSIAFPIILAATAGIMCYISLDELLPTAEKYGKHHIAISGVIAGMAIMGISLLIL